MGPYFWYVRDDDSSDRFFNAEDVPDPVQKKKKSQSNPLTVTATKYY